MTGWKEERKTSSVADNLHLFSRKRGQYSWGLRTANTPEKEGKISPFLFLNEKRGRSNGDVQEKRSAQ